MAKLEWSAQFDTGIDIIDSQHKRIVNYINQLDEFRIVHPLRPDPEVGRVINELVDYTMSHFAFEESLMADAGYDFLNAHKNVHANFTKRIEEFKNRYAHGENIAYELNGLLTSWLGNHIVNEDANYVPAVKELLKNRDKSKNSGWLSGMMRNVFGSRKTPAE